MNLGYLLRAYRKFHIREIMYILFLFWLSLGLLCYCYIGYGLLAFILTRIKNWLHPVKKLPESSPLIPVSLIVTAYNEENVLQQKIHNILELDYPPELLQVIFVTDGSSDSSTELIRRYPTITLLHQPERKGKYAAIKRAMLSVHSPVVIFSDANAILNHQCIRKIISHYSDTKVGGVAGEKKIVYKEQSSAVGQAEGIYWKYESFMKKLDSGLFTVVGAAGELFSIRTGLFPVLNDELILDDFVISMQVCLRGYKIEYEPGAFATESPSLSLVEEEKRKTRISAGAYQSIAYLKDSLNVFRHPLLTFQYISRRLMRWTICPLMLILLLLSSVLLVIKGQYPIFYSLVLFGQLFFYSMALLGGWLARLGKTPGIFTIPFYFVFMNYCLAKGFFRFVKGKQTVLWEKSLRQAME